MEKYLKDASVSHRNNIRAIKGHAGLPGFVEAVAKAHWSEKLGYPGDGSRYYTSGYRNVWSEAYVDLSCYLSEIDSLRRDIVPVLEAVMDAGWECFNEWSNPDSAFKCWEFRHPDKKWLDVATRKRSVILKLYFYFGQSKNCKTVGTGEMVEKTKIVCEE